MSTLSTTFVEGRHAGEFLLSEANRHRSRDNVVIAAGSGVLQAGTVLGKITASKKFTAKKMTAADGSQTAAAVLYRTVDATLVDVPVVAVTRDAEVIAGALVYDASIDTAQELADTAAELAAHGIIIR